jgi:protein-S-isoprenylcysteine O-methyltransferase Ste14
LTSGVVPKLIFFLLFAGFLAMRGYFGWRARRAGLSPWFVDGSEPVQQGSGVRVLGVLVPLFLLGLLGLYAVSPGALAWLRAPLPGWLRWLGAALGAMSLPLHVWTHDTLEKEWSAAARFGKSHILITQGPFRWARHPLYAALMLLFIGLALVSAFWPFLLLACSAIPLVHREALKEETAMTQRFPDEYDQYAERTGRFLPQLTRKAG